VGWDLLKVVTLMHNQNVSWCLYLNVVERVFIMVLFLQLSKTTQESADLQVLVSRELSRIRELNANTQAAKGNVTGELSDVCT